MRRWVILGLASVSGAAHAADKVLYQPAPAWVKPAPPLDAAKVPETAPVILVSDNQQRLKDGEVWSYYDAARRVASTEVLGQLGTLSLNWQPARGDLIIHRVEILRGTQRIDALAAGQFTVIRREQQLEKRQLDGELTATLAIQGLAVGDILHVAYSRTNKDPTLKGNLQAYVPLPAEPARIGFARTRFLWPQGADVRWKTLGSGVKPVLTTADGYRQLEIALPLAKQPEMPRDAPVRYHAPPMLEASSFTDWASVSKLMAPLYVTQGTIKPGSPLAAEVARIAGAESDPVKRAALALALVQDKVRYLFNGMDTGNYVPQSPDQTWTLRYGDCKAKTLLLLALLRALDVEAEPVLAHTTAGDLVPDQLPAAGAFNHILVRATVKGETLWLDGTGSGTKLADIHDTYPLHTVLPVRPGGAALMPVVTHASARPLAETSVDIDQSAGISLPAPMTATLTSRGPLAGFVRTIEAQAGKEDLRKFVTGIVGPAVGGRVLVTSRKISFDDAAGTATIVASGLVFPDWRRQDEHYERGLDHAIAEIKFDPDRTRSSWAAIPAVIAGPANYHYRTHITLPAGGRGFTLVGDQKLDDTIAGVKVERVTTLQGGSLTIEDRVLSPGGEIAPADIPAVRQRLALAKARLIEIDAPRDYPTPWQQVQAAKRAGGFGRQLAVYAQAIAEQPDEAEGYLARARFEERTGDRSSAIADLGRAIAIKGEAQTYSWRARLFADGGATDKALVDLATARKLDPAETGPVWQMAVLESDRGDKDAALALAQERIDEGGHDKPQMLSLKAELLGLAGDRDAALATIDAAVAATPGNPALLNTRCWLKGTLDTALDTALKDCTRSIELSDGPANALDSRAMVYFRLNRLDDAMTDLDAALDTAPDSAGSLFLRGVIRAKTGKPADASVDLAAARALNPRIDVQYKRYGITAP
ncbi:DUF3857 domain-containing protein [uncultured Sphingomonas sp.]|uniref:DUF3857 domain-containing protein n=1 Tax=uncultured Sphingomonas sp. TaxID=158754 RepID=UPI0035CAF24D